MNVVRRKSAGPLSPPLSSSGIGDIASSGLSATRPRPSLLRVTCGPTAYCGPGSDTPVPTTPSIDPPGGRKRSLYLTVVVRWHRTFLTCDRVISSLSIPAFVCWLLPSIPTSRFHSNSGFTLADRSGQPRVLVQAGLRFLPYVAGAVPRTTKRSAHVSRSGSRSRAFPRHAAPRPISARQVAPASLRYPGLLALPDARSPPRSARCVGVRPTRRIAFRPHLALDGGFDRNPSASRAVGGR